MSAMRGLLALIRVVGVLALALLLYAWMYPARLGRWIGAAALDRGSAVPSPPAKPAAPEVAKATEAAEPARQAAMAGDSGSAAPSLPPAKPTLPEVPEVAEVAEPAPAPASAAQAAVAQWLGNKYRVSPSVIAELIVEADKLSKAYRLSPNLIIAVMAIESNFHPYIQSGAGAQGLMQVMPTIHAQRYKKFGGKSSFMNPIVSLNVGAEILRDCARLRGGSETEALRFYFGGGPASDLYIDKVRAEQRRLNQVAAGQRVPVD